MSCEKCQVICEHCDNGIDIKRVINVTRNLKKDKDVAYVCKKCWKLAYGK